MIVISKFDIGQQVRHKLLGFLGVIIDVDVGYSLEDPKIDIIVDNESLYMAPWYHVVMEDDNGQPIHTYLAEVQLTSETKNEHPDQPTLDELSASIRQQLQAPRSRN